MKKITLLLLSLLLAAGSYAQSVGINSDGSAPHSSAMLDVKSSNKGFLPPRVYDPAGSISSPEGGLLVYKDDGTANDPAGYYYYNGAAWTRLDDVWTKNAAGINYNSSGNVGIGTTSPVNRFEVSGSTFNRIAASVTADVQSGFQIIRTAGTNDVNWEMYTPQGSTNLRFAKKLPADQSSTDILTLQDNGNVGIGTTTPSVPLHVASYASMVNPSGTTNGRYFNVDTDLTMHTGFTNIDNVSIYAAGQIVTNASFIAASDQRVKTDVLNIEGSLDIIQKLRPVQYTKADRVQFGNRLEFGFIAQEVEEILPEVVNTGTGEVPILKPFENVSFEDGVEYTILVKNGDDIKEMKFKTGDTRPIGDIIVKSKTVNDFKSITYDMIFTVAVGAIQEQQKEIEAFKAEIEALKAQNANLKAENTSIKSDVEALKNVVFGTAQLKQQ